MKKTIKIISIILLAMILVGTVGSVAFAVSSPLDISADTSVSDGGMVKVGQKIFGGIQIFGIIAAVVILAVLGIKYMMSSPEGKADYKGNMVPYIVGAVLIFGASTIANFVYQAVSGI